MQTKTEKCGRYSGSDTVSIEGRVFLLFQAYD